MVGALEQVMTLLRRIRFCLKTVENIPQRQGDQRIFGTDARQRLQVGRTDIADITRAAEQIPAGERRGKLPFEELLPDGEIDVPKSIGTPLGRDRRPYEVGVQLNPRIFADSFPTMRPGTARLPRRFAPRNDTSGEREVHQCPPAV